MAAGIETTRGNTLLLAQPGVGVTTCESIEREKPLGGSSSCTKRAAASQKQSFSLLSSQFSFRSRLSSSRSAVVSRSLSGTYQGSCPLGVLS